MTEHTHEFILVVVREDGTRVYGCIGCSKSKTVLTADQLEAMVQPPRRLASDEERER